MRLTTANSRNFCPWATRPSEGTLQFPFANFSLQPLGFTLFSISAAGAGGGEDGLAKAFEQLGNLRHPLLAARQPLQKRFQLRHNPLLLGDGSKWKWMLAHNFLTDIGLRAALT